MHIATRLNANRPNQRDLVCTEPAVLEAMLWKIRDIDSRASRIGIVSCRQGAALDPLCDSLSSVANSSQFQSRSSARDEQARTSDEDRVSTHGQHEEYEFIPLTIATVGEENIDGLLLVVENHKTGSEALRNQVNSLRRHGVKLLGIVMLEQALSPRNSTNSKTPSVSRHDNAHARPSEKVLHPKELADAVERLRDQSESRPHDFAVIAIHRVDSSTPIPTQIADRIVDCRPRYRTRIGLLASGGIGILLPSESANDADDVATDLHSLLRSMEPRGEWSLQVMGSTAPDADQQTPRPKSTAAISFSPSLDAMFALATPKWKRAFDLLATSIGLLLLAVPLLCVALLVKLTSRGPIFFRQWRTGHGGRPFSMIKFRTMVDGAERLQDELANENEQDGPAFKMHDDPRVTTIGKILRRTCIDELPQLWNVWKGEMSLVGPRPLPVAEQAACRAEHHYRLRVVPGLTCIWQAQGRGFANFDEWMHLDADYIRRRSFLFDLKLLAATTLVVLPLPRRSKQQPPQSAPESWEEDSQEGEVYAQF